jgi:hypothetical protein
LGEGGIVSWLRVQEVDSSRLDPIERKKLLHSLKKLVRTRYNFFRSKVN